MMPVSCYLCIFLNVGLRASGQYTDNLLFTGPDGLKIQVFRRTLANLTTVGVVNSVPVTFPVPFPVNCWGVFSTKLTWVQITNSCEWVSNTGFTAQVMMNIAVNTNTSDAMFLAIGY
ncbi:gp53-like domain-containing protein [Escherichia coli]|uniref:gp53-like domain-containing protein n=2 Tax=Escherichia coli TaxID=562 RepID=UPI003D94BD76